MKQRSSWDYRRAIVPIPQLATRYGLAILAVAAAFGLRIVLIACVGGELPTYILFYPAVMAVALLAGLGPGLLATVSAGLITGYWILPPVGQFSINTPADRLGLALFTCMGVFMSVVADLYRRRRSKAAAYDRELALRELQREKEFLADLLEYASQPFAVGYPDGRLGRLNHAYEQLTGYSSDELHAIDWSATLTPPEWRELEKQKLDELNRGGRPVRYEKEYVRKDGSRVPIELLVHLAKDAEGKPLYYYSFLTDISERKQAQQRLEERNAQLQNMVEELQAAEEEIAAQVEELTGQNEELVAAESSLAAERARYHDLFEAAPVGYLVSDDNGVILQANRAAVELLGTQVDGVVGNPLVIYVPPPQRESFCHALHALHLDEEVLRWIKDFLEECDTIKFTTFDPSRERWRTVWHDARLIVKMTTPESELAVHGAGAACAGREVAV